MKNNTLSGNKKYKAILGWKKQLSIGTHSNKNRKKFDYQLRL